MTIAPPASPATTTGSADGVPTPLGRDRLPWRVAARIARRDVRHKPGRTALVAGLLALPLAVVTMWLVAYESSQQPSSTSQWLPPAVEARVYWFGEPVLQEGPAMQWHISDGAPFGDVTTWPQVQAQLETALPAASGWSVADCESAYIVSTSTWTGVCPSVEIGAGSPLTGRAPMNPDEALVPAGVATIGDTLDIVVGDTARSLDVVGTFDATALGEQSIRTGAARRVPDPETISIALTGPTVTWDDVVRLNSAGFGVVARGAMAEDIDPSRIPFHVAGHDVPEWDTGNQDTALVALGVGAILLVLLLVVAPAHVVGVRRGVRSFAMLAVTGADARTLRAVVLLGAAVQGVVSAVVGVGLGLGASFVIEAAAPGVLSGEDRPVAVPWLVLAALATVAVVTVVVAALVPARTAARIDVVRVLGGRRGDAAPDARVPLVGLALTVLGLALGVWAALSTTAALVVVALVSIVGGLLLCAGTLVGFASRAVASRLSLPVRLALRDAARHRSRSVAAVTAVTAAAATLVGASMIIGSDQAHWRAIMTYGARDGAVMTYVNPTTGDGPALAASLVAAARSADPGAQAVPVAIPATTIPGIPDPVPLTWERGSVEVLPDPDKLCPTRLPGVDVTPEEAARLERQDPRCEPEPLDGYGSPWSTGTFVDDGTWVARTGLPGAADAGAALAAGAAVVADDALLHPDGTIRVRLLTADEAELDDAALDAIETVSVPAVLAPGHARTAYTVVLPSQAAAELGLTTAPGAVIALPSSDETRDAVAEALRATAGDKGWVSVEDHDGTQDALLTMILTVSALVLGVGTAGLVLFLVAGETRPDLAILSAVGASPRTRRRLAGAQASVLVTVGTALGTVVGFVVAAGFVALQARRGEVVDPSWTLAVPWAEVLAVVVLLPVGAWCTGWLTTRSRMPAPSDAR